MTKTDAQRWHHVRFLFRLVLVVPVMAATLGAQAFLIQAVIPVDGNVLDAVIDDAGNTYITGTFNGTVELGGTTLTAEGPADTFVAALDLQGEWLWAERFGGSLGASGCSIAWDGGERLWVAAYVDGPQELSFGSLLIGTTEQVGLAAIRISTNGEFELLALATASTPIWLVDLRDLTIAAAPNGSAVVAGAFHGVNMFFGDLVLTGADQNGFVASTSTSGEWTWAQCLGGTPYSNVAEVSIDNLGNVFAAGYFQGPTATLNGSVIQGGPGAAIPIIAKWNAVGSPLWISLGSEQDGQGSEFIDLMLKPNGRLVVTGVFNGGVQLGNTTITASGGSFVAEADDSGAWTWALSQEQQSCCMPWPDAALRADGTLLSGGHFVGPLYLNDIYLMSTGSASGFLGIWSPSSGWIAAEAQLSDEEIAIWGVASHGGVERAFGRVAGNAIVGEGIPLSSADTGEGFVVLLEGVPTGIAQDLVPSHGLLSVYPSPASDEVYVRSTADLPNDIIRVFDMNSAEVLHTYARSSTIRLDVSNLPAGMYVVRDGEHSTRFVKE